MSSGHINPEEDPKVAEALAAVAAAGAKFQSGEPGSRESLVAVARDLVSAVESPADSLLWTIWATPTRAVAVRVAVDLEIFQTAVEDGGRPKTLVELAAPMRASPDLVERVARACVSMRWLDEKGPGLYAPNDMTKALATPEFLGSIVFTFDSTMNSFAHLPEYLRSTKYQNPTNALDGPFQYANNWGGQSAFAWVAQRPDVFAAFHQFIHSLRAHRAPWFDMYPVGDKLIDGLKAASERERSAGNDSPAIVDVGGATGQTLEEFRVNVPEYNGRLVLQDLPHVVELARASGAIDSRIEAQAHDFFTPQPVRGARAYFVRSVLHDWPDEKCREILGHLKDAMEPGYSRILISEAVVGDRDAAWQHISLDLFMMALVSSHERTRSQWYALVESCGLRITGIYSKGAGNESVIEVMI